MQSNSPADEAQRRPGERVVKVDGGRNKVIIESWLEIGYDKLLVASRVMG